MATMGTADRVNNDLYLAYFSFAVSTCLSLCTLPGICKLIKSYKSGAILICHNCICQQCSYYKGKHPTYPTQNLIQSGATFRLAW